MIKTNLDTCKIILSSIQSINQIPFNQLGNLPQCKQSTVASSCHTVPRRQSLPGKKRPSPPWHISHSDPWGEAVLAQWPRNPPPIPMHSPHRPDFHRFPEFREKAAVIWTLSAPVRWNYWTGSRCNAAREWGASCRYSRAHRASG